LHAQFIRFLAPLILAMVAQELSVQFLNGGMARMPQAVETLAAFGLAYGLVILITGPLHQSRQLGLAMIDNLTQLHTGTRTIITIGLGMSLITAMLGLPGPGRWIVEDLHGIDADLADQAQAALRWLVPLPLVDGMARYCSGLLARARRTDIVSASGLAGIVVRITAVFALLDMEFVASQPILLPVAVTALGSMTECLVLVAGHLRFSRPSLPEAGPPVTVTAIIAFLWPLAVIMLFQGASRPLINLVVSRGSDATQSLAVLTIVYALGHIHYGWTNEIRSLAPAFRDEKGHLFHIRRFAVACCAISFALALVLFWTPIRGYLLLDLIGVEPGLAELCVVPLMIFSFFPFAVTLRSYYHGVGLMHRVTDVMAWSGPCRLIAIVAVLAMLSLTGLAGATIGVAALLCGFIAETAAVAWSVRRRVRIRDSGCVPG
jgi:progressive ankylosis protein